jgi:hypothetical protein
MEVTEGRFGMPSAAPTDAGNEAYGEAGVSPMISGRTVISRRTAIGGGLAGLAGLGGLLLFPGQLLARQAVARATVANPAVANVAVPADPFEILLKGRYHPLVNPPHLGLTSVNLNDGSYSTVKIYPQRGVPGHTDQTRAIGNFYVQFAGDLCAYNLPQGSLAMRFKKGQDFDTPISDGSGGNWLVGNFDLTILEGTGIYRSFAGGHNLMVDILRSLADKSYVEHCVCIISRP